MFLNVIEDDLLQNIDSGFREHYPYLKLVFYKNPHLEGEASKPIEKLKASMPMEEVTMFHTGAQIDISPERTVSEVEADFFHKLGLCVQVVRLSGNIYITTTETDYWTLQDQNDSGREHNEPLREELPEDFDLQDFD